MYKLTICLLLFPFLAIGSNATTRGFEEDDPEALLMYHKCEEGESSCYGIYGENCIKERYCSFIAELNEDNETISWDTIDMEEHVKVYYAKFTVMAKIIGFTPFIKEGLNLKCKPEITAKDFRVILYQVPGREQTTRRVDERVSAEWDYVFNGMETFSINKTTWNETCRERLIGYNKRTGEFLVVGGRITPHYYDIAQLILNDEIVYILQTEYSGDYFTNEQKLAIRNGEAYNSTNGILYTNFPNVEPEDKKFQIIKPTQIPEQEDNVVEEWPEEKKIKGKGNKSESLQGSFLPVVIFSFLLLLKFNH